MNNPATRALFILVTLFSAMPAMAQPALDVRVVATDLDTPWEILWGPDNWIWVTERMGRVSRIDPESGLRLTILSVPDVIEDDEAGLFGLALHPRFPDSAFVFIAYTYRNAANAIRQKVVRYRYANNVLVEPSPILTNLVAATSVDGGRLILSPDGNLFFGVGDATNAGSAQPLTSANGKILRMTLSGGSLPDNPYPRAPFPGNLVWSKGHRNPQGLVVAPNGFLYESEQSLNSEATSGVDDEVNLIEPRRNYGWPVVVGRCNTVAERIYCNDSNVFEPLNTWTPSLGVGGIDYYDNPAIPEFKNSLLLTTLKEGALHQLKLSDDGRRIVNDVPMFKGEFGRLRDLCVSPDGRIFIGTSNRDGRGTRGVGDDKLIELTGLYGGAFIYRVQLLPPLAVRPGTRTTASATIGDGFDSTNTFTLQLSDASGSFAAPRVMAQWRIGDPGAIPLTIPCDAAPGTGYRLRIVSTSPALTSLPSPPFTVLAVPVPITTSGPTTFCAGDSVRLEAPLEYERYVWSTGETGWSIVARDSGTYTVTITDINGCSFTGSRSVTVLSVPQNVGLVYEDSVLHADTGYSSYKWYRNGQFLVSGGSTYRSPTSGRYHVVVTNGAGCSASSEVVVVVIDTSTTRVDVSEPAGSLSIYPHPARERVIIDLRFDGTSMLSITLASSDGRVVRSERRRATSSLRTEIDLHDLPAGVYILTIDRDGVRRVEKVVKE